MVNPKNNALPRLCDVDKQLPRFTLPTAIKIDQEHLFQWMPYVTRIFLLHRSSKLVQPIASLFYAFQSIFFFEVKTIKPYLCFLLLWPCKTPILDRGTLITTYCICLLSFGLLIYRYLCESLIKRYVTTNYQTFDFLILKHSRSTHI